SHAGGFIAPRAGQQQKSDQIWKYPFDIAIPDFANFIVGELALTLDSFGPCHAPHERRLEVVCPRGVPVAYGPQDAQHAVGHDAPVLKLNLVQHRYDLAALDERDRSAAEVLQHQPLKVQEAASGGTVLAIEGQLVTVTL